KGERPTEDGATLPHCNWVIGGDGLDFWPMNRADLRPTPSARTESACVQPDPTFPSTLFISKSKYLWGLQCHKLLWHAYNAKHLMPDPDAQQQAIFDQGHDVGSLARQLFPGGIEIAGPSGDFDAILAASKQALKLRRPLYEAGFTFNGEYARADILHPVPDGFRDLWHGDSAVRWVAALPTGAFSVQFARP